MFTTNKMQEADQYTAATALIGLMKSNPNAPKRQKLNESIPNTAHSSPYMNIQNGTSYMPTIYNIQVNSTVETIPDCTNYSQPNNYNINDKLQPQAGRRNLLEEAYESVEYTRALNMQLASNNMLKHAPLFDVRLSAELLNSYCPPTQGTPALHEPSASLHHFTPIDVLKPFTLERKGSADHNYATASPSQFSKTGARSASNPDFERPGTAYTTSSDSGNSSMIEDLYPLSMHDWYADLMREEYSKQYNKELDNVLFRTEARRHKFMQMRMAELPTDLDYNPNKSRLRKVYDNPIEAAIRERNNLASRRSRFKKKLAQQITNIHLEFDRTENFKLLALHEWVSNVVYELETKWLDSGATYAELRKLRQFCGFPPAYFK